MRNLIFERKIDILYMFLIFDSNTEKKLRSPGFIVFSTGPMGSQCNTASSLEEIMFHNKYLWSAPLSTSFIIKINKVGHF